MKFKVGDLIKGRKDNGYNYTEERMTKAKVVMAGETEMRIRVLEHEDSYHIGWETTVDNDDSKFDLINYKPLIKELKEMPIGTRITIDREDDNVFVKTEEDDLEFYSLEENENIDSWDINDNLTLNDFEPATRIVKIEKPVEYEKVYEYSKEEKQEMTIAEIEKELGYSVKIIKEKE